VRAPSDLLLWTPASERAFCRYMRAFVCAPTKSSDSVSSRSWIHVELATIDRLRCPSCVRATASARRNTLRWTRSTSLTASMRRIPIGAFACTARTSLRRPTGASMARAWEGTCRGRTTRVCVGGTVTVDTRARRRRSGGASGAARRHARGRHCLTRTSRRCRWPLLCALLLRRRRPVSQQEPGARESVCKDSEMFTVRSQRGGEEE